MRFTPEDLKELESHIQIIVNKALYQSKKKIEILESDIRSLRTLAHKGQDE